MLDFTSAALGLFLFVSAFRRLVKTDESTHWHIRAVVLAQAGVGLALLLLTYTYPGAREALTVAALGVYVVMQWVTARSWDNGPPTSYQTGARYDRIAHSVESRWNAMRARLHRDNHWHERHK